MDIQENFAERSQLPKWLFPLLLGAGLVLWLWGGIATQQVDSLAWRVVQVFKNGGNPRNFHYPSLVIYLLCLPYGLMVLRSSPEELRRSFVAMERSPEPEFFSPYFPGHLVLVLFALLGVVAVRRSARFLGLSEVAGLAGAVGLGTALLWVSEAHLITVDLPLAALTVVAVAGTLRVLQAADAPRLASLVALGALAGLATSAKYNGAVVLLPMLLALFWRAHQRGAGRVRAILVPGLAAVAVFLATNPFLLLDFSAFLEDFAFELNHAQMGHDGYDVGSGFAFHWRTSLGYGWGRIGLVVSSLGLLAGLFRRDLSGPAKLLVLGFPVLFFTMIGASALTFQRYAIPLMPFLAIALALAADTLERAVAKLGFPRGARVALVLLSACVIVPNLLWSVRHVRTLAAKDVRRELIGVLQESGLTREKPIFCGRYGASSILGAKLKVDGRLLTPRADLPDPRADIYLFDAFSHERHVRYEPVMDFVQAYGGFEDWTVLEFSPYTVPYEAVPISQKSLYSPYLPDLKVRRCGGPMIELYFAREEEAKRVEEAAREQGVPVRKRSGGEAYFLPAIVARANSLGR